MQALKWSWLDGWIKIIYSKRRRLVEGKKFEVCHGQVWHIWLSKTAKCSQMNLRTLYWFIPKKWDKNPFISRVSQQKKNCIRAFKFQFEDFVLLQHQMICTRKLYLFTQRQKHSPKISSMTIFFHFTGRDNCLHKKKLGQRANSSNETFSLS